MNVLYTHMADHGRSWFVGAIFIMSVATYALAVYIGNVLDFIRWPPRRIGRGGKKTHSRDPLNVWTLLWHFGKAIFNWPDDDNKEKTDSPSTEKETPVEKDQSSQSTKTSQNSTALPSSQVSQSSKNESKIVEEGRANEHDLANGRALKKHGVKLPWRRKSEG
jgi:hypothetical protein